MICDFCGGETRLKKVKRSHWLEHNLDIIEDVDAEVCSECGERYFHAKTLDAIDTLLRRQHLVREKLDVEVINLPQAMAQQ
jgi:YgiT-type zinc finger domain-containing protein